MNNVDYLEMYEEIRGDPINALNNAKDRSNGNELLEAQYIKS